MATVYTKTDNYGLNLYGDNDPADLRDGYNGSMRTIDDTLGKHLNRIEGVEARETHDEAVMKALLVDNTVDNATAAKTKWDKASTDAVKAMADAASATQKANAATTKADSNTAILTALGAGTVGHATANKAKWDKASVDATAAEGKAGANYNALVALGAETPEKASALKTAISEKEHSIYGTHAVWLGDSITEGYLAGSNPYRAIINNAFNFTAHDYWMGGTGWIAAKTPSFPTQANNAIADTSYDHNLVSSIFLIGGVNDFPSSDSDADRIRVNVINACNSLLTSFPNAMIYLGAYLGGQLNGTYSILDSNKVKVHNAIIEGGVNVTSDRVRVFSCAAWLGWDKSLYNSDGLHPNAAGHRYIAQAVMAVMQGGTTPYVIPKRQTNFISGLTADENYVELDGNHLTIGLSFDHVLTASELTNGNKTIKFFVTLPDWVKVPKNTYMPITVMTNADSYNWTMQSNGFTVLTVGGSGKVELQFTQNSANALHANDKIHINTVFSIPIIH